MIDKILVLFLTVAVTVSADIILHGNCSNGEYEPFDVWGIQRAPMSCTMLRTSGCKESLPHELQGEGTASPVSLSVEGLLLPLPHGNLAPQLIVTWTPPSTAVGIENLKGFNTEIRKLSGPANIIPDFLCRVYDLSKNRLTAHDSKLIFRKKEVGYLGGDESLYRLDLYSLPRSSTSLPQTKYFKLQPTQGKATSTWTAAISYNGRYNTVPAQVSVLFSMAPESYGFEIYLVQLVDDPYAMNAFISCNVDPWNGYECQGRKHLGRPDSATSVSHTFYDVPAGNYTVWIQPRDPNRWKKTLCRCYSQVTADGRFCHPCATTHTGEIIVDEQIGDNGTSTTSETFRISTTSDRSNKHLDDILSIEEIAKGSNSALAIAVVILGVGFVLFFMPALGIFLRRRFHRRTKFKSSSFPAEIGKTVYLIYKDDHKDHVNVVTRFANYLRVQGNCQVFFLPWFLCEIQSADCYQWVISHIDKADYVIIINSEAAFKIFHARDSITTFTSVAQGPDEDTFSPAITHVMANIGQPGFFRRTVLVYFEYTNEAFVFKELNPGVQYKLPGHLKELLCRIHGIKRGDAESSLSWKTLRSTREGRDLLEAVSKATHFQKSDGNWFEERFLRSDSAYESISYQDAKQDQSDFVDSVSMINQTSYLLNDNIDEAISTVTYDTNYQISRWGDVYSAIPNSDISTTAASTEYLNMQLRNINLLSMERETYRGHDTDDGLISSLDRNDFYPPSEI